jgi:signal transduction histidine kinase
VCGFAAEISQIWGNLIDNALDAVSLGGRVVVSADLVAQRVVVSIVDDGPGIAPELQSRIFDPFFTTKPMGLGTGLGLDIVQRLLRHNNGTIEVTSTLAAAGPGRTEFRVSLPPAGL